MMTSDNMRLNSASPVESDFGGCDSGFGHSLDERLEISSGSPSVRLTAWSQILFQASDREENPNTDAFSARSKTNVVAAASASAHRLARQSARISSKEEKSI